MKKIYYGMPADEVTNPNTAASQPAPAAETPAQDTPAEAKAGE